MRKQSSSLTWLRRQILLLRFPRCFHDTEHNHLKDTVQHHKITKKTFLWKRLQILERQPHKKNYINGKVKHRLHASLSFTRGIHPPIADNAYCIFHLYFSQIHKFPTPYFHSFRSFWLPVLWPWCIYTSRLTRTGRLWVLQYHKHRKQVYNNVQWADN